MRSVKGLHEFLNRDRVEAATFYDSSAQPDAVAVGDPEDLQVAAVEDAGTTGGLFMSEIVEGSSFNKAVELYNASGVAIDLSGYTLSFYFNGSTSAGTNISLSGTIDPGSTFVIADDGATFASDLTSSANFFNGDDAIVLRQGEIVIDSFGTIGVDPGSQWTGGGQDDTMRRKDGIVSGDTDPTDAFVTTDAWDVFPQDFSDLGNYGDGASEGSFKVLLSEIVVTPTGGEFIEIHNPNDVAFDLSNLYLTDATFAGGDQFYYNLPAGGPTGGGGFGDFLARFPDGASIGAGEYQTIALSGSEAFEAEYGIAPDYELFEDGEAADSVADMREGLPGAINGQGGLTNSGEVVVLFEWDGESDLVADHDYVVWGDKAEAVDKTGVAIDGPDADTAATGYLPDTTIADQQVVSTGSHAGGLSFQRVDLAEGSQTSTGGNGVTGADETSENLSVTWDANLLATPGEAAPDDGGTGGGADDIDDPATLISAVQGSGIVSGLTGQSVVIEGIVTGDFQNGDADDTRNLGGFFVMEEADDFDADTSTSEGIFVYEGFGDTVLDVAEGQTVRILGTVEEFNGLTEIVATEIRIEDAAPVEIETIAVATDLPDVEGREALEGMLVEFTEALTFVESFDYEQFNQGTVASGGSILQYTQVNDPDAAGFTAWLEEVEDRTILIEDGLGGGRDDFDPIYRPDGEDFSLDQGIRMGQELQSQLAIMDYGFGDYRLRLPQAAEFAPVEETNPRPLTPEDVGGSLKVASLNVLNYFTTLGSRGAETATEFERQSDKLVSAILEMDADIFGLVELENDFSGPDAAIAELVTRLNDRAGAMVWNWVDPGTDFVGSDAIAVGFVYNSQTVELVGDVAILDTPEFLDPLNTGSDQNRAAVAQTFREIDGGGEFTAAVNHLKSKGSLTGAEADQDQGDGAGNNNATRAAAAQILADWLETDPTGSGDPDTLILGDLNSYAREDPIKVLEAAGYTDLARKYEGDDVYSYRFSAAIGTLDYAMADETLEGQVTGATTWNINSDEMFIFDYNENGTFSATADILRPDDQGLFDGQNPAKHSDHDPVIIGLDLEGDEELPVVLGRPGSGPVTGTDAAERLDGQGGRLDVVRGLGGDDIFCFTDVEGQRDALNILDYAEGDMIDLKGETVESWRALGNNLKITLEGDDGDYIFVRGVNDITQLDFYEDLVA